jgi:hypothetical protein
MRQQAVQERLKRKATATKTPPNKIFITETKAGIMSLEPLA